MRVPERLVVRVSCANDSDLSDIIVEMTVTSGRKNPYRVYFPKTDRSGVATLTSDDIKGQFTDEWEAGVMDHDGTLETAEPVVRVGLYDPSWSQQHREAALAWPLLTHERTKWPTREDQYGYRTSARNTAYVATPVLVNIEVTSEIVLPVFRRDTRTSSSG